MVLPFRWISVPCEEGYEFRNQVLPEQLIVTVLRPQYRLERTELLKTVEQLVGTRIGAIDKLSQGHATFGQPIYNQAENACEARVFGTDAPNKVRLAFMIRGTPDKIVSAALTRYSLENTVPLEVHAGLIFDFMKIKLT